MQNQKCRLLILLGILCWSMGFAQNHGGKIDPLSIDIYTFDAGSMQNPDTPDFLQMANAAYAEAKYEISAQYSLAHLAQNPDDNNSWYNLSCCFGLLGNAELAAKYLQVAYRKGFKDLGHILSDKDFSSVRKHPVFESAVDSLQVWSAKTEYYQGKMQYFATQQYIPYRLHIPANYDPAKKYTLVIGLHGFGDRAEKFAGLWRAMENQDIIFVVPEAPYSFPAEAMRGFSWMPFVPRTDVLSYQAFLKNAEYISNLSKQLQKEYNIGQKWLFGFSQGAYTGLILALKYPKDFDGVVACGGGLDSSVINDKDYKKAKKTRIILSHGTSDNVVPYSESENAHKLLSAKGIEVTMHSFEGAHSISRDVFAYLFEELKKGR